MGPKLNRISNAELRLPRRNVGHRQSIPLPARRQLAHQAIPQRAETMRQRVLQIQYERVGRIIQILHRQIADGDGQPV